MTAANALQTGAALAPNRPWYAEVTRYQWMVLIIASAGWAFDAMEGQIYTITRQDMLHELLGDDASRRKFWGDLLIASFLLGGTLGGIFFGWMADRFGRKSALSLSILAYSLFSGLTCFATELWHVAALRFLVSMGVGGEWAVAAVLVAEVFPDRARPFAGAIFHSTSVAGLWLAALAGLIVGSQWRYAYLIGVLPALLVFWVRRGIREPQRSHGVDLGDRVRGSFSQLVGDRRWAARMLFGTLLAASGLGAFWSVVVATQDLTRELLVRNGADPVVAARSATVAYGYVLACGILAGFLSFGPLCERLGRKRAFLLTHLAAFALVPVICFVPGTYGQMLVILPVFGFFATGMQAGYAVYLPELFPEHLRATAVAVCVNGGRAMAAPLLWISAELKEALPLPAAVTMLGALYLAGAFVLLFLPETRGRPLPER